MANVLKNVILFITNIPNFVAIYFRLMLDRNAPWHARLVLLAGIVYVVSPIDLLPGALIPLLGWLEDLVVFYLAMKLAVRLCPPEILQGHVAAVDLLSRLRNRNRFQ